MMDAIRIETDCLWPSFTPVVVFEAGDGTISDAGGTATEMFRHGRSDAQTDAALKQAALRFSVELHDGVLSAKPPTPEWRRSALLAVANAASYAGIAALSPSVEE